KGETGRELDGRTYDSMPALSGRPMPSRNARVELARQVDRELASAFSDAPVIPAARLRARRAAAATAL
ncbi:MAG TPA: hypothetical protein VGB13_06160, partial [Candidatus Krumholzibacteria bacterium]